MFSQQSPVQSGPTPEEQAAAEAAKQEKKLTTQESLQRETEQLFRLFGARGALFGAGGGLGKGF